MAFRRTQYEHGHGWYSISGTEEQVGWNEKYILQQTHILQGCQGPWKFWIVLEMEKQLIGPGKFLNLSRDPWNSWNGQRKRFLTSKNNINKLFNKNIFCCDNVLKQIPCLLEQDYIISLELVYLLELHWLWFTQNCWRAESKSERRHTRHFEHSMI